MKILSIGQFSACSMSNTCLHRNWALKKCGEVVEVDSTYKGLSFLYRVINALFVRLRLPVYFPSYSLNKQIVETFRNGKFDVVCNHGKTKRATLQKRNVNLANKNEM